jgi:integrase
MMARRRTSLVWDQWPELDRRLVEAAFRKGSVLDEGGEGAQLAPATRRKRIQGYGVWLSYLARLGLLEPMRLPAERLSRKLVAGFVEERRREVSSASVADDIKNLLVMIHLMQPDAELGWLRQMLSRLVSAVIPVRPIQPRLVPAFELFEAGFRDMDQADAADHTSPRRRASRYRDGLAIALLAACPLRRRSFVYLRIGHHLAQVGDVMTLQLGPADLKNPSQLAFPLPAGLVPRVIRYLQAYRPVLLDGGMTDRLWVNPFGRPMSLEGLAERVAARTRQHFGRPISMHLFRHAAATSMAIDDPHHVALIAALLGHARLATSERFYNMATSLDAARSYQAALERFRFTGDSQGGV